LHYRTEAKQPAHHEFPGEHQVATEAPIKSIKEDAAAVLADVASGRIQDAAATLASLGGSSGANCRRDFVKLTDKLKVGLDLYWCRIHVHDVLNKFEVVESNVPMFLPHELVGALFSYGWELFSDVLLGGVPEGPAHNRNADRASAPSTPARVTPPPIPSQPDTVDLQAEPQVAKR
jgi:hypothetical protein